jgi:hypothetical protein
VAGVAWWMLTDRALQRRWQGANALRFHAAGGSRGARSFRRPSQSDAGGPGPAAGRRVTGWTRRGSAGRWGWGRCTGWPWPAGATAPSTCAPHRPLPTPPITSGPPPGPQVYAAATAARCFGSALRPYTQRTHTHTLARTHSHALARTRTHSHARARTHARPHTRTQLLLSSLRIPSHDTKSRC